MRDNKEACPEKVLREVTNHRNGREYRNRCGKGRGWIVHRPISDPTDILALINLFGRETHADKCEDLRYN